MKNDIIVSTTDVLQDYTIQEYCGYIDASSTIGSGFLTDFTSSWTDVVGAKSKSIENKLHIIKQDVINKLCEKAKRMRCNAIIGLNVDVDEISSGQRMIFMITAVGTAVKCKKMDGENVDQNVSSNYLKQKIIKIPMYKSKLAKIKKKCIDKDPAGSTEFNEIIEELISDEVCEFVEKEFMECLTEAILYNKLDWIHENTVEVLESFDVQKLSTVFFECMLDLSQDTKRILEFRKTFSYKRFCEFFASILSLNDILSYMQKGNDYFSVIIVYQLLKEFKKYYTEEDLNTLEQIKSILQTKYWNGNLDISNLLSNDRICICGNVLKNGDICTCGEKQSISYTTYCDKIAVVDHLDALISELKEYFKK